MIKLATVFSGIGAIEHALERLNIDCEIVFASDNGGINIFDKKLDESYNAILEEIKYLKKHVQSIDYNASGYYLTLVKNKIQYIEKEFFEIVSAVQKFIDNIDNIKLEDHKDIIVSFTLLKKATHLSDEDAKKVRSSVYKQIIKRIKALLKQLNQLHAVIGVNDIKDKINSMGDYKEKKALIDKLYSANKKNYVKESYFANYRITEDKFHNDVCFIDGNQYKGKVDLFVGGSPCQSFSMVGKRHGLDDTRGTLFYDYARLISEIEPKAFIYENVRGLISHDNGQTWELMQAVFDELGYDWSWTTLNAKDFGIPQNRERLFVVGIRKGLRLKKQFGFPKPITLKSTMKDYLLDNVSAKYYLPVKGVNFVLDEKNIKKRYTQIDGEIQLCQKANQQFNWHGDFVFEEETKDKVKLMDDLEKYFLSEKVKKYVLASGTKGFYSKPGINLDIARPLLTTMHKMHRAGVDNYVESEGRLRKLTPRECLRLMGFCDSFKIVVSDTQLYRQAGNSIVVDVLMAIVNKILESVDLENTSEVKAS